MATIQERLRKLVEPIDGTMILSDACQVMPEALDRVRRHTNRTPALAWEAATHIDALEKRVKELEEELTHAWRKAIRVASNEATDYGHRVPMARMYANRIAENIRALNGGAKP